MTATAQPRHGGRADFVVPAGIDNPHRPSGGNRYDRQLRAMLPGQGWQIRTRSVPGGWPHPDASALAALHSILTESRDVALIDGLIASAAGDLVTEVAPQRPMVVLVHLPLGPSDPALAEPERRMLTAVAAVVATSGWTRTLLLNRYRLQPDRVRVARPGTTRRSPAARRVRPGRRVQRLLCVAPVTEAKGHDVLVDALSRVPAATGRPWECICVGPTDTDPAFMSDLTRRIGDAGLRDCVGFTGPLDEAGVDRCYESADLLLVPSRAETWSMVTTEALSHGLPVLAGRVGGIPEAHGFDRYGRAPGMLLPVGDPAALSSAVTRWLQDPVLRDRWLAAARCRAVDLPGWASTAATVAAVLRHAAGASVIEAGEPAGAARSTRQG